MAAWLWVKAQWRWLMAGCLVVLGFLFGLSLRRKPVVVPVQNPVADKAKEDAERQLDEAKGTRDRELEAAAAERDADIAAVVLDQQAHAEELQRDRESLNKYVLESGRKARGEDP